MVGNATAIETASIKVGAAQPTKYLPLLQGKRVGLLVNQTSYNGETHLVDFLQKEGINLVYLFAPEHGIRGNLGAGETVEDGRDVKSGLPIISIYGDSKKPSPELLSDLDIIVFDIQDVGTRFYTYISSMHYMMEAAAENNVEFLVLDRPNPNGMFVDGPVLEPEFQSFVGMHPIPVLHGLTVAELARMIKGENWINQAEALQLHWVKVEHYNKQMPYDLPIAPSPNLPNAQAIQLYPSLCFFEPTVVSIGRGTDFPFQLIGHDQKKLGNWQITPKSMPSSAPNPKLKGKQLAAMDLTHSSIKGLDLSLFIETFHKFSVQEFYTSTSFMDKLAGTDKLRLQIEQGLSFEEIKSTWQSDLKDYKQKRAPYLLYAED